MGLDYSNLNHEKQSIINQDGNILVAANPGTGKTFLLVYKYFWLIEHGIKPEEILCLTFTNKAKKELEDRLLKTVKEKALEVDISKINVHTFHSYALLYCEDENIISSNLLRYSIYKFLKENEVLNYADKYLIDTIVPKMENLIRYLKSFGILPEDVKLEKVKEFLEENEKYTKEEMDKFAEDFIEIFKHYEKIKSSKGIDYADMLIEFLKLKKTPKFKYVLVDELQDVNKIETEIVLKSCEKFIAVGDKKQAIFGFQGGSILNFEKFQDSNKFVLGENFRSYNGILDYAKEDFISKTKEPSHQEELKSLKNPEDDHFEKPVIYNLEKDKIYAGACELAKQLSEDGKKVAIIARTNTQILKLSKEMKNRKIDHSSTYFSASEDAKDNIVRFLKGLLSNDLNDIRNSMFSVFSPIKIQEAFSISEDKDLTLEKIFEKSEEFKKLRERIKTMEDINFLFEEFIIPISVSYGQEYVLAAMNVKESYNEAMKVLEEINLKNLIDYIESSDMRGNDSDKEKNITIISVHKSKGKEFNYVIYLPHKPKDNTNFQDLVVEAILKSEGINVKEELEEEALRIDFVAFTRAEEKLFIITEKPENYLNDKSVQEDFEVESVEGVDVEEKCKKAFNLFLEGNYDEAEKLVKQEKGWIKEFIKSYFDSLSQMSYSLLEKDPLEFLKRKILKLSDFSENLNIGSEVHLYAANLIQGQETEIRDDLKPYAENVKSIYEEIKKEYPNVVGVEKEFKIPVKSLIDSEEEILFVGKIDAIFKNDEEYLILDWKTDKNDSKASNHRQQLETYKRAFSKENNIPLDKIKVAIGFVALRGTINLGKIDEKIDNAQPRKNVINTVAGRIEKILSWKKDINTFYEDLCNVKGDDKILKAVIEEWEK
jgi:DNA helicase-2/ATP-dependent DNA helicase PcrA